MSQTIATPPVLSKVALSPEPIYRLLFGRPMTQILLSAHDLRFFEILAEKPHTRQELCAHLGLPVHSADMLLNACVALGLLQKEGDRYQNSLLARHYLVAGEPFYLGGLIEHFRAQVFPAWERLSDAIREDRPQIGGPSGSLKTDIFDVTQQLDRPTELFIAAMHNLSVSDGLVLADHFDFSDFRRLLDIGGGSGALSLALASRYPELQALVLDRSSVCQIADRYIQAADLGCRVGTHPADVFVDPLPSNRDVMLLSLFIHAFGISRSTPLLRKCFDALPPGGCLLIFEPVLDSARTGPLTTLLSSLNMLVCTPNGEDATAQDYQDCLRRLGFEKVFYRATPSIRHLMGGYKPS